MLGDLGEGSRKQCFVVGWMLYGGKTNSMIWYLNFYIKGGRNKVELKLPL